MSLQPTPNSSEIQSDTSKGREANFGLLVSVECELCGRRLLIGHNNPRRVCANIEACELRRAKKQPDYRQKCADCGEEKPLIEFASRGQRRDIRCGPCRSAYDRARWEANPQLLQTVRENARRNKKKQRSSREGWCKARVNYIRSKGKKNGIMVGITYTDLLSIWPIDDRCPATGVMFVFGKRNRYNPSVDRINPKLGYTKDNIRIISRYANTIKQDADSHMLTRLAHSTYQAEELSLRSLMPIENLLGFDI